ncbi:MAG TPA: zinc ABC transporter permease subunit ZnuB [Geopsychrobacteraceae bacterium]|nr:zinc ABC transporter permease subunit ZnuB [Geopsychrobacteraceae bacterium]
MIDDFLVRALLGGLGVALIAGPFGSFVVWRRLAYFGDTLAHSALLGVALGFLFDVNATLAVLAVCLFIAVLLFFLQKKQRLPSDTLLGVLAHCALSLGLVALAFMEDVRVDLVAYLFGDILAIGNADLLWVLLIGVISLGSLLLIWRPLLSITVHRDMASVEGVPVDLVELIFSCLIALVVAMMMKIVGLLLVTALLIIPAASARRFVRSPEMMALLAVLLGCLSVVGGLYGSWNYDTPAGPSIVVSAAILFLFSQIVPGQRS